MAVAIPPAFQALLDSGLGLLRQSSTYRLLRQAVEEPLSRREVERALKAAWGRPPAKELDDLADEPALVGPTGQVHRAERDGEPVAVEVQRPGLAATIRNDLVLLDALSAPLSLAFPGVEMRPLLREARERLLDELDLEHGASVQRAVRRALRREEGVVVPQPHTDLAAADVGVWGWIGGEATTDPAILRRLLQVQLRLAARDGWALVDVRPEHVLRLPGGELGLLGTGSAVRIDRDRVAAYAAALGGVREDDVAPVIALGAVAPAAAADALRIVRAGLGPFLDGPQRLDLEAIRAGVERGVAAGGLALAPHVRPHPADLWPGRGLGQLTLTLALAEPTEDWLGLAQDALGAGRD